MTSKDEDVVKSIRVIDFKDHITSQSKYVT
jgi:hypothetical protein